jgi:membrane associated rhomboid family serine protease
MFIPLHDANTLKHIKLQWVTLGLIAANIVVWLFTGVIASEQVSKATFVGLGYIPAVAFDYAVLPPSLELVPEPLTYITYAFVHSGFWHLASNMLFLWVFGDNVEDAMGHVRFLVFYLLCTIAGALCHGLIGTTSEAPLIGASGAISGVVAAYLVLHPRVRVWVLVFMRVPLPLPAFVPLVLWIGHQFVMLALDPDGGVSWGAHVGGIVAGGLLVVLMRRRGVPLLDSEVLTPRAVRDRPGTAPVLAAIPGQLPRPRLPWGNR